MESAKRNWKLPMLPILFTIAVTLAYLPIAAAADCTDRKVKRLSRQGETIATIATTCDMDADDVSEILEEDSDGDVTTKKSTGLSPGTPLARCDCWGPVSPGHREANPACNSGYAIPRMCPQVCPGGGYAWQGVCG